MLFGHALREQGFLGTTPLEDGSGQESRARSAKGFKKLDVNYSTPELGLALGISIKTITSKDAETGRYTKNYTRVDSELRAEATDYHQRQPYAMLVTVLFLPAECCDDVRRNGEHGISSFGAAVRFFRARANRLGPKDDTDLFERVFIGLYEPDDPPLVLAFEPPKGRMGARFFDVLQPPPKNRRPRSDETLSFGQMIGEIVGTYNARNDPPFVWAD